MSQEKLFHVGVKALIRDSQDRVLILDVNNAHYGNEDAKWDLPGGRIQEGQSTEETLRREVEEETGITEISDIEFFHSVISNIELPISKVKKVGLVLMIYTIKVPDNVKITLNEEHVAYKWAIRQEAAEQLGHKFPEEFTRKLLNQELLDA